MSIELPRLLLPLLILGLISPVAVPGEGAHPGTPECDPALLGPVAPEAPDWDSQTPYETICAWAGDRAEIPLGVGHVADAARFWWPGGSVRLPLYADPRGEPWGWFVNGWLVAAGPFAGESRAVGAQGMVETSYESASFIIYETRDDGWLRLRYGKPGGERDGTAWVHRCHLQREGLRFEPWHDRLLSDEISPLYFRDENVPRELHAAPHADSEIVARIQGDHHLEPSGIEGDWMKVRVKQPSDYCSFEDESSSKVDEGWVRWRREDGPVVWYFTRGC